MLSASPTAIKGAVGNVRAGWVEAEEFVEDDLELVLSEGGLHVFVAVDVGEAGNMIEEGWRGPASDFLMNLKGCSAAFSTNVVVMAP